MALEGVPQKAEKVKDDLYQLRHSLAHVLAQAVLELRPQTRLAFGPPVETGFYYDFDFGDQPALCAEDLPEIEKRMKRILKQNQRFEYREVPVEEAIRDLQNRGEAFKAEHCRRLKEAGHAVVSFYKNGPFDDLCEGPHVAATRDIGSEVFRLDRVSGAYWLGDENRPMLTRIYGLAFRTKEELEDFIAKRKAAQERDHRVLGRRLRLFHIDEMVGQGLVLWLPRGAVIRNELQTFIAAELARQGYTQVYTPHIGRLGLYRTSGHFPYYKDSQYPPIVARETLGQLIAEGKSCADLANRLESTGPDALDGYLLKPMNCPHHVRVFASEHRSYRDLPVRLAEFGTVYRWEQSGEIGGMTRVRGFTQDDAHLFCTEEQLARELAGCLELVRIIFGTLGMTDYRVRVGLRDEDSAKYTGTVENWAKAEDACRDAARSLGVPFSEERGEAAFYGPKIDFVVRDVLGREWQLGTVQVDYNLPIRFDLTYTGADNQPHRPVMIHRAPFGSMERFVGVLIEHFGGAFPTWLAPVQARVVPVSDKFLEYGRRVFAALQARGLRAELDEVSESFNKRVRNAVTEKVPNILIVGAREQETESVTWRRYGRTEQQSLPLGELLDVLAESVRRRALDTAEASPTATHRETSADAR